MNMKYKYIIWDWNGTLLNDVEQCINIMNCLLEQRMLPCITKQQYLEIFDFPVINYYIKLGFDFSDEPFEKISEQYISRYKQDVLTASLNSGAIEILKYFKQHKIPQIILSASQINELERQVEYFGVREYFEELIGLDNIHAHGKIEAAKRWIERKGINPDDMLLIGDTTHDYEVAKSIGCNCILLSGGHYCSNRISCLGVPVIDSFGELPALLNENI